MHTCFFLILFSSLDQRSSTVVHIALKLKDAIYNYDYYVT